MSEQDSVPTAPTVSPRPQGRPTTRPWRSDAGYSPPDPGDPRRADGRQPGVHRLARARVDAHRRHRDQPSALRLRLDVAELVRHPRPSRCRPHRSGLVHGVPRVAAHGPGHVVRRDPRRRRALEGPRLHRDPGRAHGTGQGGRRHRGLGLDPLGRRALRPHQHAHRPDLRFERRVPHAVRRRLEQRCHGDRRHRAGAHRKGRRLPPRGDGLRGLPRHLPDGDGRPAGLGAAARRSGGPRLGQPRHRRGEGDGRRRLHRRTPSAGAVRGAGREGDELERDGADRRRRRRGTSLDLPALLQGGAALDQLAGPVDDRSAPRPRRRPAVADRPRLRRSPPGRQRFPGHRASPRLHRVVRGSPAVPAANHVIASMVRKVGGFTFQEQNLSIEAIKQTADTGPTSPTTS